MNRKFALRTSLINPDWSIYIAAVSSGRVFVCMSGQYAREELWVGAVFAAFKAQYD